MTTRKCILLLTTLLIAGCSGNRSVQKPPSSGPGLAGSDSSGVVASPADSATNLSLLPGKKKKGRTNGKSAIDSLLFASPDTAFGKSLRPDSPDKPAADESTGLDTMIFYGADTTIGALDGETIFLRGNAWVKYQGMHLQAARITVHHPTKLLIAEAVPDSVDSLGTVVRYKGVPAFSEGGEAFTGFKMEYNFATRRGRITEGKTEYQKGYYYGDRVAKIGEKTLYIENGRFTSCDLDHPHFFFRSREMKIIVKEKVIARPIILYIHDVPIFAIPFGVFPSKGERQSGLTSPTFNQTQQEGRQLRNVGYYYAPNDYWDALAQVDFFDKAGFSYHGGFRYAKRYQFNGDVQATYSDLKFVDGDGFREARLDARHKQTINESTNLNSDIHFLTSKDFYEQTSLNEDEILNRQIRSNVLLNKTFSWGSVSASAGQLENLDNGRRTWTFPSVALTKSSAPIFKKSENQSATAEDHWYHNVRYSYNSNSSYEGVRADSAANFIREVGIGHNASISAPFQVLKYFNLTPSFNLTETWFTKRRENFGVDTSNAVVSDKASGFFARHTFTTGASVTTKLYGILNPGRAGINSLRHVLTPTLSFTYRPDFSADRWNYYETVVDTAGRASLHDRYGNSILGFGGTPRGRSMSVGLNVSNLFQGKFQGASDTTEKKLDLFSYSAGTSYNFAADSFRVSNLSSSLTVSNDIARVFTLRTGFVHDFYRYDRKLQRRVPDFNYLPRLVNWTVSAGIQLGQQRSQGAAQESASNSFQENRQYNERLDPKETLLPEGVPWNAKFDFSYSLNRANPDNVTKNLNMNTTVGATLSQNWQMTYSAKVDLLNKEIVSQRFGFLRNLHCWEMRFDWTPTGPAAGFFFIVQVKSSSLRDIKVQKTDYNSRIF